MRCLLLAALALPLLACDAVPSLSFDGSIGDAAPEDAQGDAIADGAQVDADDAGVKDSGPPPEGGCPNDQPDGGPLSQARCCGAISCYGTGCSIACAECIQICTTAEVCCPNPQGKAFCKLGTQC